MANTFLATAAFGLEGVVAGELKRMGLPAKAENGGARFEGTFLDAFRANLHLRTADRVALLADGRLCMAGTPEQVEQEALYALKHAAPGGGLVFTSGNGLEVSTRKANYDKMLEVRRKYGRYPINI